MHRILIIDDNEAIHGDFRKVLMPQDSRSDALDRTKAALFGQSARKTPPKTARPVYELCSAMQGQDGLECVRAAVAEGRRFALAFVDMRMPPGWDGLQTIERLWEVDPDLQIVICSAYSDHSWEEITERLGLTDRLLILRKPYDPVEVSQLAAALTEKWELTGKAALRMDELERLVQQRTTELSHAATHDRLTGLANRARLCDRLGEIVEQRLKGGGAYAVYFLDFDRFKVVNDSLGHEAGDELLIEIGRRLEACLTDTEPATPAGQSFAARLGGDEFVVVISGLHRADDVRRVAQRMLDRLAEPYWLQGYRISTTASIGITTSDVAYQRAEDALRDADIAMYHAKATGKARFVLFDQEMHDRVVERMSIEQGLRGVVERDELVVHYQPIISIESGALRGFEALLRWNHPERGLVPPSDFIGVAEETGEIVPIGAWVLREACRQLGDWQRAYPAHAKAIMSVNVSPRQLVSADLTRDVEAAIAGARIDPATLALEITETAIIDDLDHAVHLMSRLRRIGVRLLLDDFGTGYTSLSYLHRLPLTGLKIDREFIRSISERREYTAVVHAIAGLAFNLGLEVIAEGIEDADQVAMLQALECNYVQGFLFCRPCPAHEAEEFLRRHGTALAA